MDLLVKSEGCGSLKALRRVKAMIKLKILYADEFLYNIEREKPPKPRLFENSQILNMSIAGVCRHKYGMVLLFSFQKLTFFETKSAQTANTQDTRL